MAAISGFDHVAIPVSDVWAALTFYRDTLGAIAPYESDFRHGRTPVLRLEIGGAVLNLHRSPSDSWLVARQATVGGADICFRWEGSLDGAIARLRAAGVETVEGPSPRRASTSAMGRSIYFRDPDGNLLELLSMQPD